MSLLKKDAHYDELLQLGIDELRRLYDFISETYDNLRTKALALLAGEVAMLTFLFNAKQENKPIIDLQSVSDCVFLGVGVTALVVAFLLFLRVLHPEQWDHPPESKDLKNIKERFNNNHTTYLETLKDHYLEVIPACNAKLAKKSKYFVYAIYALVTGIFIVAVLKYGNGGL